MKENRISKYFSIVSILFLFISSEKAKSRQVKKQTEHLIDSLIVPISFEQNSFELIFK